MAKCIFRLEIDCGRQGSLKGVFISTVAKVKELIGTELYFGEVLGKHSEIYGELMSDEVTYVTDNQAAIEYFEKYNLCSGFNPFDYQN